MFLQHGYIGFQLARIRHIQNGCLSPCPTLLRDSKIANIMKQDQMTTLIKIE